MFEKASGNKRTKSTANKESLAIDGNSDDDNYDTTTTGDSGGASAGLTDTHMHDQSKRIQSVLSEITVRELIDSDVHQSVDDEFEMEEDKRQIIKQLVDKYSEFDSLKTQGQTTSLSEVLLEFELEKLLKHKRTLIHERASQHLNPNSRQSISPIENNNNCDYQEYRKRRMEQIDAMVQKPKLKFPRSNYMSHEQEVALAVQRRNTKLYTISLIKDFYVTWIDNLKLRKYKLMHRWQRFNRRIESIERTEQELCQRLKRFDNYLDFAERRKEWITNAIDDGSIDRQNVLSEEDFQLYLRSTVVEYRCKGRLELFSKKIRWLSYSERQNLFQRAFDVNNSGGNSEKGCPLMTLSSSEVDNQLEELKHCFDLTQQYDDSGQEFLFRVGKRFNAVFNAQTESWNFVAYPYVDTKAQQEKDTLENDSNTTKHASGAIHLKPDNWVKHRSVHPRISSWQSEQCGQLRKITSLDEHLSVEAAFLQSTDLVYVTKRLKDQAESHIKRALVHKTVEPGGFTDVSSIDFEGGKYTHNKLVAVHLLRHIRIREFRRKLLDILNYFRSIERRVTLDHYGTHFHDRKPSFLRQFFMEPPDWKVHGNNYDNCEINRDDFYILNEKKDLIVRDSFNIDIMYDVSLRDLQQLEERLVKVGTYYISRNIDLKKKDLQIDRMIVLEDLYESETWYQDSKRKLIDCYLEAYEHCQDVHEQARISQVILDIMYSQPNLDLSGYYFSESYASEIVSLELSYSLLRDVIKSQMRDESHFVNIIFQGDQSQGLEELGDPGLPDNLHSFTATDSHVRSVSLFPGCNTVSIFDFYSSISQIVDLFEMLHQSVQNIVDSFHISNPITISSLRRMVIQQAIVEWKLLSKEETMLRDAKLRMNSTVSVLEDIVLLEHPDNVLHLVSEIIQTETSPSNSSLYLSSRDVSHQVDGGFDTSNTESLKSQIYANAIEFLFVWKNLVNQKYETEVLYGIYVEQAKLSGISMSLTDVNPVDLSDFSSDSMGMAEPSAASQEQQQPQQQQQQSHLALAMSEFDHMAVDFEFDTLSGIRKVMDQSGLDTMRQALQFQITQRILLKVAVKYNQIALDEHYVSSHYSSFFITEQLSTHTVNKSETMDQSVLRDIFFNIHTVKHKYQRKVLEQYQRISAADHMKGTRPTLTKRRLKDIKLKLYDEYCRGVVLSTHSYVLKHDIIVVCNEFRSKLCQMRDDMGFTIGLEDHQATRHLIAKDGQIINPLYVPHFMQVIKLKFESFLVDEEVEEDQSFQFLTSVYDICIRAYTLSNFTAFHVQMTQSDPRHSVWPLEQMSNYSKRLESELNHLRQPNNAQNIISFLTMKCDLLFQKTVLTLRNLRHKISLSNSRRTSGLEFVEHAIKILSRFEASNHHPTGTLRSKLWPAVQYFTAQQYSDITEFDVFYQDALPFRYLNQFLQSISESDRNYYTVEEMNIDLLQEELLQEEGLYAISMPEKSTQIQLELLEESVVVHQLKDKFLELVSRDLLSDDERNSPKVLEEMFYMVVTKRAKRIYDKELKIREEMMKNREPLAGMTILGHEKSMMAKQRKEIYFRKKQMRVLIQEINKILIRDAMNAVKGESSKLSAELRRDDQLVTSDKILKDTSEKERIFHDFVRAVMIRGVRTKNKVGDSEVTVYEADLEMAMDLVGQKIASWQEKRMNEISKNAQSTIEHLKKLCFNLEMKLHHLQYLREMDKRSFKRRVQSDLADKNYDLVFRVDSLTRENRELTEQVFNIGEKIRKEEQAKYEDLVAKLQKEIVLTKGQFSEYKSQVHRDIQKKFVEVKENALQDIMNQKDSSGSFKTKAIEIVNEDNNMSLLKMQIEKLKATQLQMQVLFRLKMIALESKYIKHIRDAEEEKEAVKRQFFSNTEQVESREQMLRKELLKTQEQLSNTEMEVEQLKKDLQLQIKNKKKLVTWKVKNAQLLDELEDKVDKYERWNQFDVDKLVLELEKTKKEVQQHNKIKEKLDKKAQLIEVRSKKTLEQLQRKLQREQQLKRNALAKLHSAREMHGNEAENSDWQKRYFDVATELQYAQREIEILRNHLEMSGVPFGGEEYDVLTETESISTTMSRPSSASVTKGAPRQQQLNLNHQNLRGLASREPRAKSEASMQLSPSSSGRSSARSIVSRSGFSTPTSTTGRQPMSIIPSYGSPPVVSSRPSSAASTTVRTPKRAATNSSSSLTPQTAPIATAQRPNTVRGDRLSHTQQSSGQMPLRRAASAGVSRPSSNAPTQLLIVPNLPSF